MSNSNKGGRPSVGTPITTTIPDDLLAEIDQQAAMSGVTRAAEVRDLLASSIGLFRGPIELPVSEWSDVAEKVRPVTELLVRWIGHTPAKALKRYRDYRVRSLDPDRLLRVIGVARGELLLAKESGVSPAPELIAWLSGENGRPARSLLAATVKQGLDQKGILNAIQLVDRVNTVIDKEANLHEGSADVEVWLTNAYEIRIRMGEQWLGDYNIAKSVEEELNRAGFDLFGTAPAVDICTLLAERAEVEVRARP
ncbi:hypothetical protein [Streptosporangium saharense]|uniref:Ribbon-helix-helix protein CopG domain-containing protein n=1 Tax=Streptosporangium saharense TaxID=1706840 RepID=A0A7W7VL48_9ACTN|nr:hypothetical protein [Streptosporangium saharense]MBB4913800.1 hypothetical protein [Streptosporangium saharense]